VSPALLPRLAAIATERMLEPEQVLLGEGDLAQSTYVVTGGMLKLYKVLADG
jgi:CRP-like cAMP-binding protein